MAIRFIYKEKSEDDVYVSMADYERYLHDYNNAYRRYHSGPVPSLEEYIRVRLTEENKNAD